MIGIVKHIEKFSELLKSKGYDGSFMSNFGHPGKLGDTIEKHILDCYASNQPLNPIHLTTYTKWEGDERPYVRCDFNVTYDQEKEFEVKSMDINYSNTYGNIRTSNLTFRNNSEIPDRAKANEISNDQKRKRIRF
jgi:hypothetical protein